MKCAFRNWICLLYLFYACPRHHKHLIKTQQKHVLFRCLSLWYPEQCYSGEMVTFHRICLFHYCTINFKWNYVRAEIIFISDMKSWQMRINYDKINHIISNIVAFCFMRKIILAKRVFSLHANCLTLRIKLPLT